MQTAVKSEDVVVLLIFEIKAKEHKDSAGGRLDPRILLSNFRTTIVKVKHQKRMFENSTERRNEAAGNK